MATYTLDQVVEVVLDYLSDAVRFTGAEHPSDVVRQLLGTIEKASRPLVNAELSRKRNATN
jgi:hypothetical protein